MGSTLMRPAFGRCVFLECVAARLRLRGSHFTDADLGADVRYWE
jgi:hypothetical protein